MNAYADALPDAPPSPPEDAEAARLWPHNWICAKMPDRSVSRSDWAAFYRWSSAMYRQLGYRDSADREELRARQYEL